MNQNFFYGILLGITIFMIVETIKLNVNPPLKTNTKIKIYIDGNFCKVERIKETE